MRITNGYAGQVSTEAARVEHRKAEEAQDSTSFSSVFADETRLGSIASALHQSAEHRDARVAELRQQFLNGSYHVDAAALSRKIVDEHIG